MSAPRKTWEERAAASIGQMTPGTLGGRVRSAGPAIQPSGIVTTHHIDQPAAAKPYATVVVAASDSVAAGAADADFVCDGTADEEQINDALDLASTVFLSGEVLLLEGTYYINSQIGGSGGLSWQTGMTLRGMGRGTVLEGTTTLAAATNDNVIYTGTGEDMVIRDLTVDCKNRSITGIYSSARRLRLQDLWILDCNRTGTGGVVLDDLDQVVTGCYIKAGSEGFGIYLNSASATRIRNCHIDYGGINVDLNSLWVTIEGCHIVGVEANATASVLLDGYRSVMQGNTIVADGSAVNGVRLSGRDCNVSGNYIEEFDIGVVIEGDIATVDGNTFLNCGDGIEVDAAAAFANITGNTFSSCSTGIDMGGTQCAIVGNNMDDPSADGIDVSGDRCTVTGNHIGSPSGPGIYINGSYNAVSGNSVHAGSSHGIEVVDGSLFNSIDGNTVYFCATDGIQVNGGDDNLITNNLIVDCSQATDNTYDGIVLGNDSNDNTILGNTVRNGSGPNDMRYGVNISNANCNDNRIVGNDLKNGGQTAAINDAGTGTLNTWAGGTATGDNRTG